MYKLKIDILQNNLLTKTYYSEHRYPDLKSARFAAQDTRNRLFNNRAAGKIRDYTVDVIPAND